jgi:hypothetical protein
LWLLLPFINIIFVRFNVHKICSLHCVKEDKASYFFLNRKHGREEKHFSISNKEAFQSLKKDTLIGGGKERSMKNIAFREFLYEIRRSALNAKNN